MEHKIAVPLTNGVLSSHFGHCALFAVYTVKDNQVVSKEMLTPPPHEPGSHPAFLSERGCDIIIAGGMGERAQGLFCEKNIRVHVGASVLDPDQLISDYLAGKSVTGTNRCDH